MANDSQSRTARREQSTRERTAVVRAGGTERKKLLAASREQDRLVFNELHKVDLRALSDR